VTAAASVKVAALTKGAMKAMFITKIKTMTAVLLAVALAFAAGGFGIGLFSTLTLAAQGEGEKSAPKTLPAKEADLPKTDQALRAGPPRVLAEHQSPVASLAWSADGRRLAAGTQDGTVHVTEAATGKVVRSFPTHDSAVTVLAFSPDGKALELFNKLLRQSTWDAGTGEQLGGYLTLPYAVDHLAFMPSGQWVVAVNVQSFCKRQFVRSGPAEMLTRGGPRREGYSAVAPDGTVSGFCDATGRLVVTQSGPADKIDLGDLDDDVALDVGKARPIAFGPGGKLLAVGDDKGVQLWDLTAKKKTQALAGLDQPPARLAIAADGLTLAGLAADGKSVLVWDLKRSTTRCKISHNQGAVGSMALSPDGKMLATTVKDGKAILLWKAEEAAPKKDGKQ
jgi:WD40 repeat protein